jgi:hypothetical protein
MNVDPATIDAKAIQQYAAKTREQGALDYLTHIISSTVVGAFAEGETCRCFFSHCCSPLPCRCSASPRYRCYASLISSGAGGSAPSPLS